MFTNPFVGIDTIRVILTLTKLHKMMRKLNLEYEKDIDESLIKRFKKEIDRGIKDKETKEKDYKLDIIKISSNKSLFGYILVKNNYITIQEAKRQKKSIRNNKRQLIFTSLDQPLLSPTFKHINTMYSMINEFLNVALKGTIELDISIDGKCDTFIIKENIDMFKYKLNNYISFDSTVVHYENSFYINNPKTPVNKNFELKRINIYDKYKKHIQNKKCTRLYKNWHRIESTYKINIDELSESIFDEVIDSSLFISNDYFGINKYDTSFLETQIKKIKVL